MRALASLLPPLAAVLISAAVQPARAQQAVARDDARPVVRRLAAPAGLVATRTLAVYQLTAPRATGMPARVTVADSASRLVASFRLAGAGSARPMLVEVLGSDLVLQGETPDGVLTLRLYDGNGSAPQDTVSGRWWLGHQEGALRGRAAR